MRRLLERIETASARTIALWSVVAAALCEGVTLALRFGLDLQTTRDTAFAARFTFGYRVHHSYIGAVVLLLALTALRQRRACNLVALVGASLLLSDLMHHFAVLWPLTGSPQFDLVYPTNHPH